MGRTKSAKCEDSVCVQATPNLECEYGDGWCQTHVMGGGGGNPDESVWLFEATPGLRVSLVAPRLEALGLEQGDVITHINGKNLHSLERAAALAANIQAGTELRITKADGARLRITV